MQLSRISLGSLNTILFTALPNLLVGSHVRHMKKGFRISRSAVEFLCQHCFSHRFLQDTQGTHIHFVQHVPCFIFSSSSLPSQRKEKCSCKPKSCAHSSAHICIKKKLCSATAIWQNSIWSLFFSSSLLPRIISNGLGWTESNFPGRITFESWAFGGIKKKEPVKSDKGDENELRWHKERELSVFVRVWKWCWSVGNFQFSTPTKISSINYED